MALNFKLPFAKKTSVSAREVDPMQETIVIAPPARPTPAPASSTVSASPASSAGRRRLPLIGELPATRQLAILGTLLFLLFGLGGASLWISVRDAGHGLAYISAAGQLRTSLQQLARSTPTALQGNAAAFKDINASRDRINQLLDTLTNGGEVGSVSVSATSEQTRPALQEVTARWAIDNKNLEQLQAQEKGLLAMGQAVSLVNQKSSSLFALLDELAASRVAAGGADAAAANQLALLGQRIVRTAGILTAAEAPGAEEVEQLRKDIDVFRDLLAALTHGNDALRIVAVHEPAAREKLTGIETLFMPQHTALTAVLANQKKMSLARQAGVSLLKDSPMLQMDSDKLFEAYAKEAAELSLNRAVTPVIVTTLLAVVVLLLMAKVFNDESATRNEESERQRIEADRQRREAEASKDATQEAILRLMNEMGDLADGDLTVRATVTENITGAIADSVNYTIEELSVLVKRINETASRVATASENAQNTSVRLLEATETQSHQITEAGDSVLGMAQSMGDVSAHALESARVARHSLDAAQKGSEAVTNSIKGMNEIREQIQETSKRIKRLGESSQEIGEIVELISDITEQTNVLALNAAIQAASAGEAGRGFSVVAEEVQRLAERSGEATKQIAAIVKTIQTDTHDAVLAMEYSTRNVVDGARLSDAAGQALQEISSVSSNLAQLIENISSDTQHQADSARQVAESMQTILHITEQTTDGTKQTATSISELSTLAGELKASVAGFKV